MKTFCLFVILGCMAGLLTACGTFDSERENSGCELRVLEAPEKIEWEYFWEYDAVQYHCVAEWIPKIDFDRKTNVFSYSGNLQIAGCSYFSKTRNCWVPLVSMKSIPQPFDAVEGVFRPSDAVRMKVFHDAGYEGASYCLIDPKVYADSMDVYADSLDAPASFSIQISQVISIREEKSQNGSQLVSLILSPDIALMIKADKNSLPGSFPLPQLERDTPTTLFTLELRKAAK